MKSIYILKWMLFFLMTRGAIAYGKSPSCRVHYFAFDVEHLACLKKMTVVQSLKENFVRFEALKKTCAECKYNFPAVPLIGTNLVVM
jgi:hypothetical protein